MVRGRAIFQGYLFETVTELSVAFSQFLDISRNYGCPFQEIFRNFRNYGPDFHSIYGIMTLKCTRIYGIMGINFSGKMARPELWPRFSFDLRNYDPKMHQNLRNYGYQFFGQNGTSPSENRSRYPPPEAKVCLIWIFSRNLMTSHIQMSGYVRKNFCCSVKDCMIIHEHTNLEDKKEIKKHVTNMRKFIQ